MYIPSGGCVFSNQAIFSFNVNISMYSALQNRTNSMIIYTFLNDCLSKIHRIVAF